MKRPPELFDEDDQPLPWVMELAAVIGTAQHVTTYRRPVAVNLRVGAKLMGLGTNAIFSALKEDRVGPKPKTFRVGGRHLVLISELEAWGRALHEGEQQ